MGFSLAPIPFVFPLADALLSPPCSFSSPSVYSPFFFLSSISGHSFPKDPKTSFSSYDLLFDAEPSPHVELRCQEVLAAVVPPEAKRDVLERGRSRRLGLRRKVDGVVVLGRGGGVEYLG